MNKKLLIGGVVVVLAVGGFYYLKNRKRPARRNVPNQRRIGDNSLSTSSSSKINKMLNKF